MAKIVSLNISTQTGTEKKPVESITVRPAHGMEGDAHARDWHRQLSLLAMESLEKMAKNNPELTPGSFAENITTEGINLPALPIGTRLICGEVELEVTQIGKKCHAKCNIFHRTGDCIMPKEGIFAKVITGGVLRTGDQIVIQN